MAKDADRWTLEDLIDFESEVASSAATPAGLKAAVVSSIRGLDGASARRTGLRVWLEGVRTANRGGTFTSSLALVGSVLALVMFLAGFSGVLGMVDREKTGIHVTLFLAVLIGVQWLVLLLAVIALLARRRTAEGFSAVQAIAGRIARRIAGAKDASWWGHLMHEWQSARKALLWRFARMAQAAGISFNLGILSGLIGLVMVKHVGFFWETTTEVAMHSLLERLAGFLSLPWSAWWPGAVPDAAVIDASRWVPERELPPGPAEWWQFLLMTTLVWGMLPRLLLWIMAWKSGRDALANLDFQTRAHRALWRDLTGTAREESDDRPLDGVLVLDVGGSGLTEGGLHAFFLRRLRVHPSAWHSVAVLDPGEEQAAARAMANAPAGVVLLAEGWALSPARMKALHSKVRTSAGAMVPVRFLIANTGPDQTPAPPSPDERHQWETFVDSLQDPEAEVFFFENPQDGV